MKEDICSNIEELRKEYGKFREKYGLPEFSELNKVFDIEDVDTDTEFLLRKIRRVLSDRITNYLRFSEVILNPTNAPMFFFKLIKKLDDSDKAILGELYETLGNLEIEIIDLDLDYSEEKEAEFIKKIFRIFNEHIKLDLLKVIRKMSNGEDKKKEDSRGYFG